jgi:multiple sugar transport system ATP-binding protein
VAPTAEPPLLGIRPEHLTVTRVEEGLAARIDLLEHLGDSMLVHATLRGTDHTVSVRVPASRTGLAAGVDVGLAPDPQQVLLFSDAGESLAMH